MGKKEHKHRWRVGSFIGTLRRKRIIKDGINIWCEGCNKKIRAYYHPKYYESYKKLFKKRSSKIPKVLGILPNFI